MVNFPNFFYWKNVHLVVFKQVKKSIFMAWMFRSPRCGECNLLLYEKNLVEGFSINYKDAFTFCEGYV
jgi:hypothetical protein